MRFRALPPAVLLGSSLLAACTDSPTAVQESAPTSAERRVSRPDLTPASTDPVLVGAGDMHADCVRTGPEETALLLDAIDGTVFTLGDNSEHGTTEELESCYADTWGRHLARTKPIPGDNDYLVAGAEPYKTYFGLSTTYYSYDLGGWHVIALDSNIPSDKNSAQYEWLQADLAANPSDCAIAYWHHSRFSSTRATNDTHMKPIVWKLLDSAGVDVVLSAHYHGYERFAPQDWEGVADPEGIRLFVVGTGGKLGSGVYDAVRPTSEVRDNSTLGVLELTLHATSYSWEFVPVAGGTFTDSGSSSCVQTTVAPTADAGGPYAGSEGSPIAFDGSASTGGGTLTYDWDFGDGSSGSGATPSHAYADDGTYTVKLEVTSDGKSDSTQTTAVIDNVAPTATFVAPSTAAPDSSYTLSLTDAIDAPADLSAGFTYAFDCGDGFGDWGSSASTTCPGVSATGPRGVGGRIRDQDLDATEYADTVEITTADPNQKPVASVGGPYSGAEGSSVSMSAASSSDPEGQPLTFEWDFGDGATGTGASTSHAYADNGTYTVTVVVTDQGGLADTAATSATISNVKPNGKFNAPSSVPTGTEFTLSFTNVTDPSSADVSAGFTYRFDCGSGFGAWITESSTTCPGFDSTGSKRVRGKVRDKDKAVRNKRKFVDVVAP